MALLAALALAPGCASSTSAGSGSEADTVAPALGDTSGGAGDALDIALDDGPGDVAAPVGADADASADADGLEGLSDAAPDVGPDVGPDTSPDAEPDLAPDAEPDVAPDAEPDIAPHAGLDVAPDATLDSEPDVAPDVPAGPVTALSCFEGQLGDLEALPVDYDAFGPTIASHCKGTDHQEIVGVERVVFVGDSVTVGTPPTPASSFYRVLVAVGAAERFGLEPPDWAWQSVDVVNGVTIAQSSASDQFWSCAKWGARTDDITKPPHEQLVACNPESERDKTTLVVTTVGGNDVFAWAQDYAAGETIEALWAAAQMAIDDLEASLHWLVDEPARFPNGVYAIVATPFEFSDLESAEDFSTCPGAGLISMDWALVQPEFLEITRWFAGEYMRIAVETGVDIAFMGEHTCGHGAKVGDASGRCYRGPDAQQWIDFTCIHPSPDGHVAIADLFLSVIDE